MKQLSVGSFLFLSIILFNACDSKKSDAKKLGELFCASQKLISQGKSGSPEFIKIDNETKALSTKMQDKYKDTTDQKLIFEIFIKEASNCK
jgi:hypothetical protein